MDEDVNASDEIIGLAGSQALEVRNAKVSIRQSGCECLPSSFAHHRCREVAGGDVSKQPAKRKRELSHAAASIQRVRGSVTFRSFLPQPLFHSRNGSAMALPNKRLHRVDVLEAGIYPSPALEAWPIEVLRYEILARASKARVGVKVGGEREAPRQRTQNSQKICCRQQDPHGSSLLLSFFGSPLPLQNRKWGTIEAGQREEQSKNESDAFGPLSLDFWVGRAVTRKTARRKKEKPVEGGRRHFSRGRLQDRKWRRRTEARVSIALVVIRTLFARLVVRHFGWRAGRCLLEKDGVRHLAR